MPRGVYKRRPTGVPASPEELADRKARDSARATAWAKANPERARASTDRARKKHNNKYNERRRAKYDREARRRKKPASVTPLSFSIVSDFQLRRPTFRFRDARGNWCIDKWETAEELARKYQ